MNIQIDQAVEKFMHSLETKTVAKVLRTIDLLEMFGVGLGMPHAKKIKKELFELRTHGDQNVRIFYIFLHGNIVLVHAYIKKSQKIPKKELLKVCSKAIEIANI